MTSAKRSPALPDVPTIAESGVKDFDASSWFAVFAPAKTPQGIVDRLNAEIRKAIDSPDVKERFDQVGGEARSLSPGELRAFVEAEYAKWAKVVKASGAKVD